MAAQRTLMFYLTTVSIPLVFVAIFVGVLVRSPWVGAGGALLGFAVGIAIWREKDRRGGGSPSRRNPNRQVVPMRNLIIFGVLSAFLISSGCIRIVDGGVTVGVAEAVAGAVLYVPVPLLYRMESKARAKRNQ